MATGAATGAGVTACFSTFAGAAGLALETSVFESSLAEDFGLDLITDLVLGLAGLPELPGLAGTGLAAAWLPAADEMDFAEDFLTSGLTAGAAIFNAGLAEDLSTNFTTNLTGGLAAFAGLAASLTGLIDGLTATFGIGLAFEASFAAPAAAVFPPLLATGFIVVALDIVFAGPLAGGAGFLLVDLPVVAVLAAAFMIGLLSNSARL